MLTKKEAYTKWYKRNKVKRKLYARKHREENRQWYRDYQKKHIKENPELHFNNRLKTYYGINLEYYKKLLKQQNDRCAICYKHELVKQYGKLSKLSVDHCHKTNRVRGLLCKKCNSALGLFQDSPVLLSSAWQYLERQKKSYE